MAGSVLGPDQVKKINAVFPTLVSHLRSLLAADHTGVGLMRVHSQVETFDSDEMSRIFRELSFISPKEKLALVRAAIYELIAREPASFISPEVEPMQKAVNEIRNTAVEAAKVFTPTQFKLNVATSGAAEIAKTDTVPTPPPATSTHASIVAKRVEEGNKRMSDHAEKLEAAAKKFREESAPKVVSEISIHPAPTADVNLQAAAEAHEKGEQYNEAIDDATAEDEVVEE